MERRDFFGIASVLAATTYLSGCNSDNTTAAAAATTTTTPDASTAATKPEGAVTLYYEFRIASPEVAGLVSAVNAYAPQLDTKAGFLSVQLKNTVGTSTMVQNLPVELKGALKSAHKDAVAAGLRPQV